MPAKQIPSAEQFVVKVKPSTIHEIRSVLMNFGAVDELKDTGLLLLNLGKNSSDPKSLWERILDSLASVQWVAPALLDEQMKTHFPTGDVSVRFDHNPTQDELKEFGSTHGLLLRAKNEFIPEQASFRPAEPSRTYLPDLTQALSSEKGVEAAWANTLSHYRRTE